MLVSRATSSWISARMSRYFDIDDYLAGFFSPQPFRLLQAEWGAIISGLHVVSFLTRERHPEDTLHVYLSWEGARAIGYFLLAQGYSAGDGDFAASLLRLKRFDHLRHPHYHPYVRAKVCFARLERRVTLSVAWKSPVRCVLGQRSSMSQLSSVVCHIANCTQHCS